HGSDRSFGLRTERKGSPPGHHHLDAGAFGSDRRGSPPDKGNGEPIVLLSDDVGRSAQRWRYPRNTGRACPTGWDHGHLLGLGCYGFFLRELHGTAVDVPEAWCLMNGWAPMPRSAAPGARLEWI